MKNKLFFVTLLLLIFTVFTSSFVLADELQYTGSSFPMGGNYFDYVEANGLYYYSLNEDNTVGNAGVWECQNQDGNCTKILNRTGGQYHKGIDYNPDLDKFVSLGDVNKRLYIWENDFSSNASIYTYTQCNITFGENNEFVDYYNGAYYVFSKSGIYFHLSVIDANTYACTKNVVDSSIGTPIGTEIKDGDWYLLYNDGRIDIYSIDNNIDSNDFQRTIDTNLPISLGGNQQGIFYDDADTWLVWDSSTFYELEDTFDIDFPYQLLLGEYYFAGQQCIYDELLDYYSLCNDTSFNVYTDSSGNEIIETRCNSYLSQSPCIASCSSQYAQDTTFNVTYIYGICDVASCTNECNTFNGRVCVTSSSYVTCANYDSDVCWEWGTPTQCSVDQYCDSSQERPECADIDFDRLDNELVMPFFDMKPYALDGNEGLLETDYTDYTLDALEPNRINVETTLSTHVQSFGYIPRTSSAETFYIAKNCDYEELVIYNESFDNYDSSVWTFINNASVVEENEDYFIRILDGLGEAKLTYPVRRSNTEIEFDVSFENNAVNESLWVVVENDLGSIVSSFMISEVGVNGELLTFRELNATTYPSVYIFNDSGVGNLEEVKVTLIINYESDFYTLRADVTRNNDIETHYSVPFPFYASSTNNVNIRFVNSFFVSGGEARIDDVSIISTPLYPSFYPKSQGDYNIQCTYNAQGCYEARFYLNVEGTPVHLNTADYTVCMQGDLTNNQVIAEGGVNRILEWLNRFDENEKFLIGILGFFLLIALGIYFTIHFEIKSGGILTGIVGVAWLLLASKFGMLPTFVTTILIVLTGTLSAIKFIRALGGKED